MSDLKNKEEMDKEAESTVQKVRNKVRAVLDLFLRNRNSGTTTALKAAIARADSPIILSGDKRHGRSIAKSLGIDPTDITVVSWESTRNVAKSSTGKNHELIPDNYFMIRALDSVYSVINFLCSEVKRVQNENKRLRDKNRKLRARFKELNERMDKIVEKQDIIKEDIEGLIKKIESQYNGS